MRRITLPPIDWSTVQGREVIVPVKVSWPELSLTDDQILANGAARAAGHDDPYPDQSIFEVVIPRG